MSFNFEWPRFSDDFYESAKEILAAALNKGEKPPIIADRIEVKELDMGTIPPELEILEIGDLSTDRFRGIFRLSYSGDAFIVLQTKVQANPLNVPRPSLDILGTPRILFAAAPLVVPMTLRLSNLSLRAIVVLVVSRQKGITLVFKNDPLESVNVSSSFDGVESVAGYIQREIEAQLREAFRSDLPSVIHRLSQKWLSGEVKAASSGPMPGGRGFDPEAKIETRTTYQHGDQTMRKAFTTRMSSPSVNGAESVDLGSQADTSYSTMGGERIGSDGTRPRRTSFGRRRGSLASSNGSAGMPSTRTRDDVLDSVPESIESYDPTYGLRPNAIASHAGFASYERVVRSGNPGRGLGDVLEGQSDQEDEFDPDQTGDGSFDFDLIGLRDLVDDGTGEPVPRWEGTSPMLRRAAQNRHRREYDDFDDDELDEFEVRQAPHRFETIPAVGGGTITRPRVFHTQSQMRTRTASSGSLSAHGSPSTAATARAHAGPTSASSTIGVNVGSPPDHRTQHSILENGRLDGFGRASVSGASSARFPFPKVSTSSGSLPATMGRSSSSPNFSSSSSMRKPFQVHRSALSSQLSTSGAGTRGTSSLASGYSSPPSSVTPPRAEQPVEESLVYPPARPTPIDLLSCSPSSILNNTYDDDLPITINPSANDQCAHLATLTHSNQTLSPFTRNHEHFTARSTPHVRVTAGQGVPVTGPAMTIGVTRDASGAPIKAKRKRVHRIGAAAVQGGRSGGSAGAHSPGGQISPPISTATSASSNRRFPMRSAYTPSLTTSLPLGGVGKVGRAPSELSAYFPSMSDLGRRAAAARRRG